MPIKVRCGHCQKLFHAADKWAGYDTACLNCGATIRIGAPERALQVVANQQLEWNPPPAVTFSPPVAGYRASSPAWPLVLGVALVAFVVGFFSGREYLKWEARSAMAEVQNVFQRASQGGR